MPTLSEIQENSNTPNTHLNRELSPLEMFELSLPEKPYCTDQLGGLFVLPRQLAIKKRYVQQNSPYYEKWLVFDVDDPTATFSWYDLDAPPPNIVVTNPENGHAHLLYGLEVPIIKQPKAHAAPLRYGASVSVALTKLLNADPNYSGLICKNPCNNYWIVQVFEKYMYELGLLSDFLDLEPYKDRRKYLPPIGLGRNCYLFDATRFWAYRQVKKKDSFFNEDFFVYVVTEYAAGRNAEFPVPLPPSEVKATGKSVGRWTWRHMSKEGFNFWGDNRRNKSIVVRQAKSQERAQEIRAYKAEHPEAGTRAIGEVFKVGKSTVERALGWK
jgi:hypothetical protein